jgi:uncharacterized DUF497 family protein
MRFEWDEAKRRLNLKRHAIDFVDAEEIFAGETIAFLDDRFEYGEIRLLTFGLLNDRVVVIAHTETEEVIRVISIRRASKNEEELYFKQVKD